MPHRILYVASTVSRTGPTNQLLGILTHLDRTRFDPHILTLSPEPVDTLQERFEALGIPVHTLGRSRLSLQFGGTRRLLRRVAEIGPDILHTHGFRADVALAGITALRGFRGIHRHIATVHNDAYKDYPASYGPVLGYLMARRHTAALRHIPVPVAVSDAIARLLAGRGIEAVTIRNGIDTDAFIPAPEGGKARLRSRLGLPTGAFIVIYTGVFISRKRCEDILKAFHEGMGERAPDTVMLVMAGDGPLRSALMKTADNRILFPGMVSNVADWLAAADLFVSASSVEGLPMAVIEALACGVPAILSDIPPHVEIRDQAPEAVRLFALGDVRGLADAMWSAADEEVRNPSAVLSERVAARAAALTSFSARMMSEAYQSLYTC